MIFYIVKLFNYFPVKGGASDHYSPKAILAGELMHHKHYSIPFGMHCMAACTQGAISLGPSSNAQGGGKNSEL